ncbi:MAG: hypothetical protein KDA65_03190 [Planctomycetaceae bacterium]|nr:hypothetical protein [Planctomycetaceae bacterium]
MRELLDECGWEKQSKWYEQNVQQLHECKEGSPEYLEVLRKINSSAVGMDSFSDLPLKPKATTMSILPIQDRQQELAAALATVADEMLQQYDD